MSRDLSDGARGAKCSERGDEINVKDDSYNYGLSLLRSLICFGVILLHFRGGGGRFLAPFSYVARISVPCFMFLSFFLVEKHIIVWDVDFVKKRMWRIVYPWIVWAFIYWCTLKTLEVLFCINYQIRFSDLFWQLFTGHSSKLNSAMWFQFDLAVLTVLYLCLFRLSKRVILTCTLFGIALGMQYSGINSWLFGGLRYELKYPLGRLCEMIPYASLGLISAYFGIYQIPQRVCRRLPKLSRFLLILIMSICVTFLMTHSVIKAAPGFMYSVNNNIPIVLLVVGVAYLLPVKALHENFLHSIKFATRYTLGIYCMHILVGKVLGLLFLRCGVDVNKFMFCIMIYGVCFGISFLLSHISKTFLGALVE